MKESRSRISSIYHFSSFAVFSLLLFSIIANIHSVEAFTYKLRGPTLSSSSSSSSSSVWKHRQRMTKREIDFGYPSTPRTWQYQTARTSLSIHHSPHHPPQSRTIRSFIVPLHSSPKTSEDSDIDITNTTTTNTNKKSPPTEEEPTLRQRLRLMRELSKDLAKNIVIKPISSATPMPGVIAAVLRDAADGVVDELIEPTIEKAFSDKKHISSSTTSSNVASTSSNVTSTSSNEEITTKQIQIQPPTDDQSIQSSKDRINKAFDAVEHAIDNAETALQALQTAKLELQTAKSEALNALSNAQNAAAATTAITGAVAPPEQPSTITDIVDRLSYEDIDFSLSGMSPPFIGDDQCLVPGVPMVRVEKAPENSRRIFAGIDIQAGVDDVWRTLTDYKRLQEIVPNLVVNEVLELYNPSPSSSSPPLSPNLPPEQQCQLLSQQMKGAKLRQIGGAKVVGINFSARTTLEVREWPRGLPDFAHFQDDVVDGKSRQTRVRDQKKLPLKRYAFPRPYAISKLPTMDITMQSLERDDGEFRLYQGVWRMQPLPGCAPMGKKAMRLTYAVEISPRAYLPVSLVENRIAADLCCNLEAIRDVVTSLEEVD